MDHGFDSEEEEEKHCPVKPPAQACWSSGRLDISNKTYETIAKPGPTSSQSQSEDSPPPLPIKNSSRTVLLGRAGDSSRDRSDIPSLRSESPEASENRSSPASSSSSLTSSVEPGGLSQALPSPEESLQEPPGTSRPGLASGTTPAEVYLPVRFSSESTRSYRRGGRNLEDSPAARLPLCRRNIPVGLMEGDGSKIGVLPASSLQLSHD